MLLPVMKALLRLHRIKYSVQDSGRMDHLSVQVGQILELASASDLEPVRDRERERERECLFCLSSSDGGAQ